jgi:large-conductance mechanosensitive channel
MINKIFAADGNINLSPKGNFANLTKVDFSSLVGILIQYVLIIAAIVFFFVLLIAGIKWITSEGDEKKVGAAKAQLTNALIGLAIIFGAWAIMGLISQMFLGGQSLLNLSLPTIGQ